MSSIPYPIGTCRECGLQQKPLIAKHCFTGPNFCYQQRQQANYRAKQKAKPARAAKPIAPVSKNRMEALRTYRRRRDAHFKKYPKCQFPGCESRDVTLHHAKGRIGAFLTDKRWFKSLCWPHHLHCERHPAEAQRLGLSFKRLDNE